MSGTWVRFGRNYWGPPWRDEWLALTVEQIRELRDRVGAAMQQRIEAEADMTGFDPNMFVADVIADVLQEFNGYEREILIKACYETIGVARGAYNKVMSNWHKLDALFIQPAS